MLTPEEARSLAREVVSSVDADEAEALVIAEDSALTRFANSRINQNVAEENALVNIRAVVGKRVGVASTNRLDAASLRATAEAAVAAARVAPEDPAFPGLPAPEPVDTPDRTHQATRDCRAEARAQLVEQLIAPSRERGLTAAGKLRVGEQSVAVANSRGVDVGMAVSNAAATVLAMGDTGSGWSSFLARDVSQLDAAALGAEAADLALRTASPGDLEPGVYPVVLGYEATAGILEFMGYMGFSAKSFEEGRSFMSGRIGDQVLSEMFSVTDDATSPDALGLTFDFEGMPKRRLPIMEGGVPQHPVTDSYWSAKAGWPNTGHALPAPNPWGPMALDLSIEPGESTLDELIGDVELGVYITRFHYINVEDPIPLTLTGMTRDGTFLIENGQLTRPLKNLRFTQSMVDAFRRCWALTADRRFVATDDMGMLVPAVKLDQFNFTGQTD